MNNVFGRTLNPYCLSLTAGGSSGGEGALVGFHGSPLGVGTDIGGSIRVPALCGGTFGFKPTASRVPFAGQASPVRDGLPGLVPAAGPLCHTAADLTFFTREVIMSKPWTRDSTTCHVNWRHVQPSAGLNIGLYLGHPEYPLTASVLQALEKSAAALREAGHRIIPIDDLPSPVTAMRIASEYLALDNKQTPFRNIEAGGEKPIKALEYMTFADAVGARARDLDDVWRLNVEVDSFREEMFQCWRSAKLDVLLCPVAQHNAVPHDTFGKPVYTFLWNLLDVSTPLMKPDTARTDACRHLVPCGRYSFGK
jgi:amidase